MGSAVPIFQLAKFLRVEACGATQAGQGSLCEQAQLSLVGRDRQAPVRCECLEEVLPERHHVPVLERLVLLRHWNRSEVEAVAVLFLLEEPCLLRLHVLRRR